jgi:hypothetical protein
MLAVTEDEIRKGFSSYRASITSGNISSEPLFKAMLKLYIQMRRKRSYPGLNDRSKQALDQYLADILKLIFLHLDFIQSTNTYRARDVALLLYDQNFDRDSCPLIEENLEIYTKQLRNKIYQEYPMIK